MFFADVVTKQYFRSNSLVRVENFPKQVGKEVEKVRSELWWCVVLLKLMSLATDVAWNAEIQRLLLL